MDQFLSQIFAVIHQIPYGKVTTYGDIARFQDFRAMRVMLVKRWVTCPRVANYLGIE